MRLRSKSNNTQELEAPLLKKHGRGLRDDPFSGAGPFSKLTFSWLNTLFETGKKERLEFHHVPLIPQSESAEVAFSALQIALLKQKTGVFSLSYALINSLWKLLAINAVFAGINTLSAYSGPFLIASFVNFLSRKDDSSDLKHGYLLAFLFLFAKSIESISQRHWYFGAHRLGIRSRAALSVLLYQKCISFRHGTISNGKIINTINVDVERIGDFFWYIHGFWLFPFQVFLALVALRKSLGWTSSIAALFATILIMMCNTPLARLQERLHTGITEAKDSRIRATAEVLKNMRVLKLHSWEISYMNKLLQLRESERNWLRRYLYTCSAVAFLFWASPTLISVVGFGVCVMLGMPLTSSAVLSALATFRILQEPIYNLPEFISMMVQTKVSIKRIEDLIKGEDRKRATDSQYSPSSGLAIEIEPGKYTWDAISTSRNPSLDLCQRIKIMKGSKVAVCGSVGSGKSSLLCGIIDEIPRISGNPIKLVGSKAYAPQSAWVQTGTVRDNILFGKKMEADRYREVVEACALDRDIESWQHGDMTIIGERGINLSGGQKQRIQLARAIYSDSDVYLFDDPFSAVDATTGVHLFRHCLLHTLAEKTVVYVTHQLEFLQSSDLVLVMKKGKIVQSGRYDDLVKDTDNELSRQMEAHNHSLVHVATDHVSCITSTTDCSLQNSELIEEKACGWSNTRYSLDKENEEDREHGRVRGRVYSFFVRSAYGGALIPLVLLCQMFFQALQIGSNYWISWGSEWEGRVSKDKLIGLFVLLSVGSSIFILARAVLLTLISLETSQRLFRGMLLSIFHAPISFFDSTPSSQILNRFSADQSIVDTDIPYRLAGLAFALIQLLAIITLMSQIAWQVFVFFFIIIALAIWYQVYYISTARELARMVGVLKTALLHHFSQTISGAAVIRCFNQELHFAGRNLTCINNYSRVVFHNSATMEWLSIRINFLFNLVFFLSLILLVKLPRTMLNPSLAGVAATYGLNLNVLQAWVIWNLCNVENKMISVERIMQFSELPSEAPSINENCRPESDWPASGTIEIENLCIQYVPGLPMVVKDLSCIFPGGCKIGIVGRTGSGKSTVIQALFRMVEPAVGRISIDGVDISKIGLWDLRSRLSIIPQDPTLFHGTMRSNLDPLLEHTDYKIWEVLNKCQLREIVTKDQRLLDLPVAEDGHNWSLGQKQLVCLARVLLNKRKILVLDEATASVDIETDNMIQKTIREEADKCTIITIAHRIPTIIDNDLVLVLDQGKLLEFDSPTQLLKEKSSAFSKLVNEFVKSTDEDVFI